MAKKATATKPVIAIIIALVVIAGGAFYITNRSSDEPASNQAQSTVTATTDGTTVGPDTESSEYKMFAELKGDDYDRVFLSNMIEHHQGAVDMAELANTNAQRQEIKDMSAAIIAAQTGEIDDMKQWQKDWGFPASSGEMMMDHSAMGMMTEMETMTDALNGLSGEAFDKKFVELMIEHHQSAINMSAPGATNAKRQEVKELSQKIVADQSKEIAQMKQWQKDWGFTQ
jgi:uncharacterized protein (DUF305 family)